VNELPQGTVTFCFTDIEGSTELLRKLGDRYGEVLSEQRRILRETFSEHGGREVDNQGDALFFSFERARDAISGAVAGQRALASHDWPDGNAVKVRMGLHTGEPAVGDEGYVGLDVVRAARICSAGHGGQILLSETTRVLVGEQFPDGAALRDLGRQHLKDVEEERIYQLSIDGQPDRFPALKTESRAKPSRAEVLGENFEQRITDFVTRTLEQTLAGKQPPPLPGRHELPARRELQGKEIKPVLGFAFAIVCALIVGLIAMVVVVKLLFF
jgi:class 3 adenylate cyclase